MELSALLRCPACHSAGVKKNPLRCADCGYESFALAGIPWYFKEPRGALAEWRNRFQHSLQLLTRETQQLELDSTVKYLLDSSRSRLRKLKKAKQKQIRLLHDVLAPLQIHAEQPAEQGLAFKIQVPMSQNLMTYYSNVHRDWVWGEAENQKALELLSAVVKGQPGVVVTLGAGACRLSYDFHRAFAPALSLAVDINPFLLLLAGRLISGKSVSLYEFPLAPLGADHVAVENQLKAPQALKSGFHFLLADALNPPLSDGCADLVITPWFIDIIPQDVDIFFRQINRLLRPGGTWVNFGSFAFHHKDWKICYAREEFPELIGRSGFKTLTTVEENIPYLQSPHSCQKRFEKVLVFSAEKTADCETVRTEEYLPEWIRFSDRKIPGLEAFKSYAFINQIHLDLLSLADGSRSLDDIAREIAGRYKMPPAQAVEAVRSFFSKVYEENLFRGI